MNVASTNSTKKRASRTKIAQPTKLEVGEKAMPDWGDFKPQVGSAFVTKSGKAYKVEKDFSIIRIR